jgi:hypothetical protein
MRKSEMNRKVRVIVASLPNRAVWLHYYIRSYGKAPASHAVGIFLDGVKWSISNVDRFMRAVPRMDEQMIWNACRT